MMRVLLLHMHAYRHLGEQLSPKYHHDESSGRCDRQGALPVRLNTGHGCCTHPFAAAAASPVCRWAGQEMPAPPACCTHDTCVVVPHPSSHSQGHTSSCHTYAPRAQQRACHWVTHQMMQSSSHCCCCRPHPLLPAISAAQRVMVRGQLPGQWVLRVRGQVLLRHIHLLLPPLVLPGVQHRRQALAVRTSCSSSSKGSGSGHDWCRIHTTSTTNSSSSTRLSRRHRWVVPVCHPVCQVAAVVWT